ncbi:MAG: alpha/beta hydrolase [Burkholderiales bacterium]|nr:alpha/beta hydrolase [Burkholderiales bacterium]
MTETIMLSLAAVLLCAFAAYFLLPHSSARALIALNRKVSGLSVGAVTVGPHSVRYLSGGRGAPVLLLHGIFAEKDHWVDFARALHGAYTIYAPDLPGFGESRRFDEQRYDYDAQIERVKSFLDALGVERAHIAGSSMGGTLAALFALRYPTRVMSVAFIGAPHGIRTPTRSEMDVAIDAGRPSPLIANTETQFEAMLGFLFHRRPWLPYPVAFVARANALRDASSNVRIWHEQLKDRYLLDAQIDTLQTPTLVLWGEHDRLFDASGAAVLRQRLPHADVQPMPNVGHLPILEAAKPAADAYTAFLSRVNG